MQRTTVALLLATVACTGGSNSLTLPEDDTYAVGNSRNTYGESAGGGVPAEEEELTGPSEILDQRQVDYGAALRIASLKLIGEVPNMERIRGFQEASDKKAFYEAAIDEMLQDPRFATMQLRYWRNTFKSGGNAKLDAAATFAAMTVVQDRPYTDLFTAQSGTCPTFNEEDGTFTEGNCDSNGPTVGVLSDAGLMQQLYAPMAFRRVRFIQETFACAKLPVEYSKNPTPFGAGIYTGPYPVTSISGALLDEEARIDFHDSKSTMCVNCHVTLNHAAPLFANYNDQGVYNANQVQVFLPSEERAELTDWLPEGEPTAWRFGTVTADLAAYGAAMAADPDVARCAVTRAWNYAFSRGNVVDDASPVPRAVSDGLLPAFQRDFKVKPLLRAVFTSDDFVRF